MTYALNLNMLLAYTRQISTDDPVSHCETFALSFSNCVDGFWKLYGQLSCVNFSETENDVRTLDAVSQFATGTY